MRRPPQAALVWLAAASAALTVGAAALTLSGRLAGESGLPKPEISQPFVEAGRPLIDPVMELALFGRAVNAEAGGSVAESDIGLMLHGVVIAADAERSSAIVSGGAAPAQVYFIGDAITSAASLDAVFGDHVLLSIDGQVETLSLPKAHARSVPPVDASSAGLPPDPVLEAPNAPAEEQESLAAEGLAALRSLLASARGEEAPGPTDVEDASETPAATAIDGVAPADVGSSEGENAASSAAPAVAYDPDDPAGFFDVLRKRFHDSPESVLDTYGLTATPDGYRVGTTQADTIARIGLAPDDLIVSANGRQVGRSATDHEILDEVFASGQLRLEVERAGERLRLSFPLR